MGHTQWNPWPLVWPGICSTPRSCVTLKRPLPWFLDAPQASHCPPPGLALCESNSSSMFLNYFNFKNWDVTYRQLKWSVQCAEWKAIFEIRSQAILKSSRQPPPRTYSLQDLGLRVPSLVTTPKRGNRVPHSNPSPALASSGTLDKAANLSKTQCSCLRNGGE